MIYYKDTNQMVATYKHWLKTLMSHSDPHRDYGEHEVEAEPDFETEAEKMVEHEIEQEQLNSSL